jgi:predicted acyltransferase (DUF342 family)
VYVVIDDAESTITSRVVDVYGTLEAAKDLALGTWVKLTDPSNVWVAPVGSNLLIYEMEVK